MKIEASDKKSNKKNEWEKYLYPFPKTERMVYYNKVVEDICKTCHRLKPQTYIREQQSFRWDTKVKLQKLNKALNFYHNDASGVPKYRKVTESKKCDKKVCTSLLTKVEKTITEGEALDALLTQRRERLLDESASGIKKGSEEEVNNLNGFKGELQTVLSQLKEIENDLCHSQLSLSRSRSAPTTVEENARIKRRKKENKKKIRKQAKCRLMNRCTEILDNLLGADTSKNTLSCIELSQEIPTKISDEKEMQVSQLYNLKPKFHLKALSFLRDKGIFCGEALCHVDCTLHRLKTTTQTTEKDSETENEEVEESEDTNHENEEVEKSEDTDQE